MQILIRILGISKIFIKLEKKQKIINFTTKDKRNLRTTVFICYFSSTDNDVNSFSTILSYNNRISFVRTLTFKKK